MANMGGVTMWGNRLKILIFTRRAGLRESLQGVSAGESCLIEFLPEQKAVSEQACAEADIVLLDLELEEIPLSVRSYCKSAATQMILLDPSGLGAELDESGLLAVLDGIWQPPFTEKRLAFYFQQTVRRACAQQKLWRMEHLLDALIDSVPDLIWFKDTRGAHLKVNDGFCQMVHKTKQQCEGCSHYYIWDIDPEEYQKGEFVCMESEEQVMQEKKTCVFDEKIKGLDGHMMQFRTYKSPIFDFDGTLLGTMGVAHDVTDWKNKSAELNVMLNTLREPAMVIGAAGNIFTVNQCFCEFFQKEKAEFLGLPYAVWKTETLHSSVRVQPGEKMCIAYKSSRGKFILEFMEEPIFDVFHQKLGYFCIFRDITEHENHRKLQENYKRQLETDVRLKTRTIHDIQKQIYIGFADLLTSRDHLTGDHIRNTSLFVDILLEELKREDRLPEMRDEIFCEAVSRSVPLHDIGKLGVPDAVLYKQGKYTAEEYSIMRQHALKGKQIIDKTLAHIETFKFYRTASDMAVSHHERWDGQGYPRGLRGRDIPLAGRIMAVADVFDALISKRTYNATLSIDQAYVVIKANAGTQFDPEIAAAFIIARPKIEQAVKKTIYRM